MIACKRCRACEEHCLCTQPEFRTVDLNVCFECVCEERKEREPKGEYDEDE